MSHSISIPFDDWLSKARAGNSDCLATLLDAYRNYLRLLARLQISRLVRVRVSPSDVAQESILRAKNAFGNFRGQTEAELLAWLRRVLASELALTVRFHSANRRDVKLEQRIDHGVEQSSCLLASLAAADQESPSRVAVRREQSVILAEALDRLPENYREIIVLRHLESYTFPEISQKLNRTVTAVKSTWTRAIKRLRVELKGHFE